MTEIEREAKSWTWVNERPCPECGFDASSTDARGVPDVLRASVAEWRRLLSADPARLVARPDPTTWSPLEYACHVRDVLDLLAYRFERVLAEEHPVFEDWHPNDRAIVGDYAAERDASAVMSAIADRADRVAVLAEGMTDDGWARRGTRADGVEFTNAWLSTYLTHDVVHHVHDVELILG